MVDIIEKFPGRLGIQQRVLPIYRAEFFDYLAQACSGGLSVFSGGVHNREAIPKTNKLNFAQQVQARNYHFLRVESPFYMLWQANLVNWLRNWDPDVLIVEANPRYISTQRAIKWMHNRGKKVIGWGLGAPPINSNSSIWGKFVVSWQKKSRREFLDKLDALIAYSHKGAQEYHNLLRNSQTIFVAPNSAARRPSGQPPRRTPGFEQQPCVLFVGRLQKRKRIDNLLFACAALPQDLQPQLVIVGDGPVRADLERLARSTYPAAEFPGEKRGLELEELFERADLFVLPGTGGLAVQEAMAFGLPVIVAEGDGTQADLVRSGNGWLIPADNKNALIDSLKEALSDPRRLQEMGAASFKVVKDEINIEHMVSVFVDAANQVHSAVELKT